MHGNIVRSRVYWYERNSKHFLDLENIISGKNAVCRLFDSKGSITVNLQTIMKELRDYFQNLNRDQDSHFSEVFSDFLDNNYIPFFSEQSKTECEEKLSCAECCKALLKFPNGKTSGNDGLTAELYKGFWNLLGQQLTDSLNFSLGHGELSNLQKQAFFD